VADVAKQKAIDSIIDWLTLDETRQYFPRLPADTTKIRSRSSGTCSSCSCSCAPKVADVNPDTTAKKETRTKPWKNTGRIILAIYFNASV
jgi:hypothetical protein